MNVEELPDEQLTAALKEMAREERGSLRRFIVFLREFDRRALAGKTHHATTFRFCTEELKLSAGETYKRLQVVSVIGRLPALLEAIEEGVLTLSSAALLCPYLTTRNYAGLVGRAAGKPTREVESIVAEFKARPENRTLVTWMSSRAAKEPSRPSAPEEPAAVSPPSEAKAAGQPAAPAPSADIVPAASDIARLHFNVPREVLEKLERARGLLRHKYPKGDFSDVVNEALEALLARLDRGRKETPADRRPVLPGRRRIPEWVKDEVWRRDGGRCAFHSVDGRRCDAAEWLEFDHVTPFALGGVSDDPDNVRLLCRAHNQHRAREDFGDAVWSGGGFEPGA